MKDKKFLVLLALAMVWTIVFIATAFGDLKLNPNVERFITFIFLGWAAYWSFSIINWAKKSDSADKKQEQPTEENKSSKP